MCVCVCIPVNANFVGYAGESNTNSYIAVHVFILGIVRFIGSDTALLELNWIKCLLVHLL